ncbi:MAG: phosphatidate cytidylyltransferase [candidate division FCPU426 bacterium]
MFIRFISSAVILPGFIWLMFYENPLYFRILTALAVLVAYHEYRSLMRQKSLASGASWPGLLALAALLIPPALSLALPLSLSWTAYFFEWCAAYFILAAVWSVTHADLERGVPRFLAELCGPVYLGALGLNYLLLHRLAMGPWWVLLTFWYAWIYDAGALFAGKALGKRKFSTLSPQKTWEGFYGGILFSALMSGLVLPYIFKDHLPLSPWLLALLSVPASLLAQAGDLFESMLKRFGGVKDSSAVIVGQGGFLDKMDSSLFVAPYLYGVAVFLGLA